MPTLEETAAAQLAEREGIVSHLTSLVLVDEAGATQSGLPALRKVHVPDPATDFQDVATNADYEPEVSRCEMPIQASARKLPHSALNAGLVKRAARLDRIRVGMRSPIHQDASSIAELARRIDWGHQPSRLLAGDVSQLAPDLQEILKSLADRDDVKAVGQGINATPLILVIALIAREAGLAGDRSAERIARSVLKNVSPEQLRELALLLRL